MLQKVSFHDPSGLDRYPRDVELPILKVSGLSDTSEVYTNVWKSPDRITIHALLV